MFQSWTPLIALLLLITDGGSSAKSSIYKQEGDEVVISPGPVAGPITSIEWKHQDNIASEWNGRETVCYRDFKGRCQLNKTTGELIITDLLKNDSGSYTAEINYKVLRTTEILVISAVPTPTITTRCNTENTDCTLTCEGNTEGAEPVNYEWMSSDSRLGSDKELKITKEEKNEWFRCTLVNPVNNQTSEQVPNPFNRSPHTRHYYATVCSFILLILLICGLFITRRKLMKEKFKVPAEQHLKVFDSLESELDDDDVFERTIEKFPTLVLTFKYDPEEPTISEPSRSEESDDTDEGEGKRNPTSQQASDENV